uniref:F-box domain-containing protein n=2 Tax=Odontella aurita TaxID=265563 RepID=A0A7S4MUS3_9STRA|mmetsp:Transcript_32258/g.96732  ORF Transcript_32258/g.96732 Transcript_32258/m.96732 type:complete len:231 (+) Transcript_32258:344-1036(+)|eukprot:CAMPEP_0113543716 /NCGR_PEP_ID=MMETSP0015_2-20120614/10309_1 /TAXON_ID=2838 /ORGANISM="Odontella" /LENGTH=230 /DNA_ID=CAMNT_0000443899 /DNA_START=344 /DNA_END=1036 /DNA_ORIENTATION=- /assembly_acc=CAM_ASM_000160
MDGVPDVLLSGVLSYLPRKSHLPVCHISRRFRSCWLEMKHLSCQNDANEISEQAGDNRGGSAEITSIWAQWDGSTSAGTGGVLTSLADDALKTSPLQIGNIFKSPWNKPGCGTLQTSLLRYYVLSGWNGPERIRKVMHGAAARGDVDGMAFLVEEGMCNLDDKELCTVAGAAGQLDALIWLREKRNCPWDPTEVYREASENIHEDVMTYVEMNSAGYQIQTHYGVGLPVA